MLNYIENFIDFSRRTTIPLIKFDRFVTQIKRKNDLSLLDLPNFRGVKEIEQLMYRFNLDKFIDIGSDYDRLNYLIENVVPKFNSFMVANQHKYEYRRATFIDLNGMSNLYGSTQMLLMSNESNYFKFLPMGSRSLKKWYEYTPLNIIYHNSPEYTTYMNKGTISFSSVLPDYFVLCMDIVLLLMHYCKICILTDEKIPIELYIKDFLWSNVQSDMKNIWLLNLIYSTIKKTDDMKSDSYDKGMLIGELKSEFLSSNRGYYSFLKNEFENGVSDILKIIEDCSIGKVYPETLLNSIKLTNGQSLIEHIKDINEKYYFDDFGNTRWINFMKDLFYIKLMLQVFKLQPRYSETKNLLVSLKSVILSYKNSRFWNAIKISTLRVKVEEEMKIIENLYLSIG